MDDEDLYDEFGNLIGNALDSDAESVESNESNGSDSTEKNEDAELEQDQMDIDSSNAIVLHEDKKYYNSLSDTFGKEVETIIQTHDKQSINEPLVKPITIKKIKIDEKDLPELTYSREYLLDSMSHVPDRIRNIALVGNLHSGKTSFLDMLILQTHKSLKLSTSLKNFKPLRYMDNHKLEIERGISIKSTPISLLLPDLNSKSFVFNIIDAPGHVNFFDEVSVATTTADSISLIVDAVEGVSIGTEMALNDALKKNIPITVVLNKIDRLILELKLPVTDAYHKLRYTIELINKTIQNSEYLSSYTHKSKISPELNNVLFASSSLEFCFNLRSFAKIYIEAQHLHVDLEKFSQRLWGDIYFNSETKKFTTNSKNASLVRSFNYFILEPIYKIFSLTLTSDSKQLSSLLWNNFGAKLPNSVYKLDSQILLKEVCKSIFNKCDGFVDMVSRSAPSPIENMDSKLNHGLGGIVQDDDASSSVQTLAHITKLIESADGAKFYALVRVYKGTLKLGDKIKILGENYEEDEEDFKDNTIEELYLPGGRYRVPIIEIPTGGIALVGGVDSIVSKSATIHGVGPGTISSKLSYFKPINYIIESVLKVAIEPKHPSELPKLLEGLRKINKSYVGSVIKVEESGEHVILAPGEIYMDCLLHDLRHFFTDELEVKVSEPITKFNETVVDRSITKISTNSNNGKNKISITVEPIDDEKLINSIEIGKIDLSQPIKSVSRLFKSQFKWDALSARSIWCFGPDENSPNILLDDTLESETDKKLLYSVKDSIKQGFKWASREGPLCDEPIRNTKFKIMDVVLNADLLQRGGGQIIPMTRKACYTGFLTATPRLMEPIYSVHVTCTSEAIKPVFHMIEKRRGGILKDSPLPATQLYNIHGYVPVIDSVGLETEIRLATQGQAMCLLTFAKWDVVPGDPLDKEVFIPKLRPAPINSLARDFVMKTRKRKGLSGEPNLSKYLESELVEQLKRSGLIGL